MKTRTLIVIVFMTLTALSLAQGIKRSSLLLRDGSKVEITDQELKPIKLSEMKFKVDLSNLTAEESKGIEDKRALKGFSRPHTAWRVGDGYFAYYDGGEFGGALFYYSSDGTHRSLILADHAVDISPLAKGGFVVAGGCCHGGGFGAVYRITKNKKSGWSSELLMRSFMGVPTLMGRFPNNNFLVWNTGLGTYTELRADGWMRQREDIDKFESSGDPFPE